MRCMRRCVPRRAMTTGSAAKPRVLLLAGPTGVGKSRLAIDLAKKLNGEIISADSAAIFRGLDYGTSKPDAEMRKQIPHHLLDVADVTETFTVQQWSQAANDATMDILSRGKVPIVVGGSGLYDPETITRVAPWLRYFHWYMFGGNETPDLPVHPEDSEDRVREFYTQSLEKLPLLLDLCLTVNPRRVARALQKLRAGVPLQRLKDFKEAEQHLRFDFRAVFLTQPRVELLPLLDYRCEKIVQAGLIEETAHLVLDRGLYPMSQAGLAIGYRQALDYLQEGLTGAVQCLHVPRLHRALSIRYEETWFKRSTKYKWLNKLASEVQLSNVVRQLYQCDEAEYEKMPHTASRELSARDRETLRQYSSELCLYSYGAAAKQARTAETLAARIRPVLQQQALMNSNLPKYTPEED